MLLEAMFAAICASTTTPAPRIASDDLKAAPMLFIGDSITQGWMQQGVRVWQQELDSHSNNMGVGGDKTENVIDRVDHANLRAANPKVVFLMIGTNNLAQGDSPECIREGVEAIVGRLRGKLPDAEIVLISVLPRRDRDVSAVNTELRKVTGVHLLDFGARFEGTPENLMWDGLHLTEAGYQIWAQEISQWSRE